VVARVFIALFLVAAIGATQNPKTKGSIMKDTKEYDPLMRHKNWVEAISTPECIQLMKKFRSVCEKEISYVDASGFIVTEKRFPRDFLNKYYLYRHLREHKLCPKCGHAEKVLKSEAKGK
jgi:hypothetical protein